MNDEAQFAALVEVNGSGNVVLLRGELDMTCAPQAEAAIRRAMVAADGPVRIDLSELTFIDAAGVRVLDEAQQLAPQLGCRLTLTGYDGPVERVLRALRIVGGPPISAEPTSQR